MTQEYDVIVIGAGVSGGIPAAAYLQKAGAKVLLIDANDAPAYNCRSYTWQGATCTPCAGGFVGGAAPMWQDLELEKFGASMMLNPRAIGTVYDDNTSLFIGGLDHEGVINSIAKYSEKDAQVWSAIMSRVQETFLELADLIYYQPASGANLEKIIERLAYVADVPHEHFARMDAWEFLDYRFEDDHIKQMLAIPLVSTMVNANPDRRGEGAAGVLHPFYLVGGQMKGSNQTLVDSLLRVFNHFDGELWLSSPVASIAVENGKAIGVKMAKESQHCPGELIRAKHAVISNVGAIQTYHLLGDEVIRTADDSLATKMKHWDNQSRPSSVNVWLLKDMPRWSAEVQDPYLGTADWLYIGLEKLSDWRTWHDAIVSGDQAGGFQGWWEVFIPGGIDADLRGPNGEVCFRVESVVPYNLLNEDGSLDDTKWESYKWELVEKRTEVFERFAPGFKDLVIDVVMAKSPRDLWNDNRAMAFGCAQGGAFTGDQSYMGRMPYRMPISNLYMSNSVWPGNLTWCGSGHIVAGMVAEDMGIRDQSWWVSKPGEWFMENAQRLAPTGAGWKYMADLQAAN